MHDTTAMPHRPSSTSPHARRARAQRRRRVAALGALACAAGLGACTSPPTIQTGEDAETIMEGRLARVDNSRSSLVYVDPQADYGRYENVWFTPLDVDHVEIVQPNTTGSAANRYNREWELDDEGKTRLKEAYTEAMERTITNGGRFAVANAGGDDVLRVDAMLTRLAPTAPPDDARSRGTRSTIITEGAGSMSIAMVLRDGDSGEVLAIIKDTRSSGSANTWTINNSVSNMAEVRRLFNTWGARLHDGLIALQERPVDS